VNRTKHMVDMGRLSEVASCFLVLRMFGVEGKDGVIPTLGDGWCNPNLGTRGGFYGMV
jgi:hypothetical protein